MKVILHAIKNKRLVTGEFDPFTPKFAKVFEISEEVFESLDWASEKDLKEIEEAQKQYAIDIINNIER